MRVKGYLGSVELGDGLVTIRKKTTGTTSVPVESIQAVSVVPAGLGMKAIRVAVAGGSVQTSGSPIIGTHANAAADPYALTFRSGRRAEFEAFAVEVQRARSAALENRS